MNPLGQLITGYWQSQAVYTAAKLELADRLAEGPKSIELLASETNTHGPSLFRLLRALATTGLFREEAEGTFSVTKEGRPLCKNGPGSQWAMAIMMGEEHYRAWGELLYSVRTGEGAFRHIYGRRVFEFLGEHPEQAAVFDAAMTGIHGRETQPMLEAYDFSPFGLVADIGGGNGSVLREMLRQYPTCRGLLVDLPHVVERAKPAIEAAGLRERCSVAAGDFFREIPAGADLYFFRHIVHDWLDDEAVVILQNCRRAMKPTSRVLVAESIVPAGNDPAFVKWLDLTMLVIPEGRERTEVEYRRLFAQSDLKLTRIVPTGVGIDLIEGEPI